MRRDRTAHGGGVAIWVKSGISFKELDMTYNNNIYDNHSRHTAINDQEIAWISVEPQGSQRVGVCGAYRPGTCSDTDTTLLDAIDAGIDNAKTTCSRIIVAGDFNVHNATWLGSTRTTVAGEAAEDLCYLHGLEQYVQEPTRGRNRLDLIMSDMEGNISTSIHQPLGKSDHATVLADFDQLPLREPHLVEQCGAISVLIGAASEHFLANVTGPILLVMM